MSRKGNLEVTVLLLGLAILIIFVAAINFTNFSTALTPLRVRSINTQKVLGSSYRILRGSLLIEAVLISLIAMLFGTYLGGYWILKFILFPLGLTTPFLSFLFMGLTICVPFMGYYYVRMYRNTACGGSISFLHAWIFTVFMYMFAALLTAMAHYIYFRFIDHGFVINAYESQIDILKQSGVPGIEAYTDVFQETLDNVKSLTPIDITMQLVSWNVFCGSLLALPTALFVMRRKKE